jgi:hypothetical protein
MNIGYTIQLFSSTESSAASYTFNRRLKEVKQNVGRLHLIADIRIDIIKKIERKLLK